MAVFLIVAACPAGMATLSRTDDAALDPAPFGAEFPNLDGRAMSGKRSHDRRCTYPGWDAHCRINHGHATGDHVYRVWRGDAAIFEGLVRRNPAGLRPAAG